MAENRKEPVSSEKRSKREFFRFFGVASTVGINFVVSTFAGFAIGYVLDSIFGTTYLKIIFLVLGIIAGFKYLFKIASKAKKYEDVGSFEKSNSANQNGEEEKK